MNQDKGKPLQAEKPPRRRSRMKEAAEIRWERLDNTANLFPVISTESTTNVYRISAILNEVIDPELLQEALNRVLPLFDLFNVRLRKGFFWCYLERNGKPAPRVREEDDYPCRYIAANRNNSYLFRVTYYKTRINLEVFHVLTDGMGSITFLKELIYQYLRLAHEELRSVSGDFLSSDTSLNREDSYLKNYRHKAKKQYKTARAFHLKGEHIPPLQLSVIHGYLKLPELKGACKRRGLSINQYLVAVFVWSIYQESLHGQPSKKPISVCVPVNLRPFYDSNTTKNFFTVVSAVFHPEKESYTFEEVLAIVKESLTGQITKENLEQAFSYTVSKQKKLYLRVVPLFVKNLVIRQVYRVSALANTSTVTNVGPIGVEKLYEPYIRSFYTMLAMSLGQDLKAAVCSYQDTLVWSFTSTLSDVGVQRAFFRKLVEEGIPVELESNMDGIE